MTKAEPRISVIVPVYNAADTITRCIESISRVDYPDFEIIAVDDASTDGSGELLKCMPCKYVVLRENSGPGIARNRGADIATGEILAFTDADCEVSKDWLKKIVVGFGDLGVGGVTGPYAGSVNRGTNALFQFYDARFRQISTLRYAQSCSTSNFACKKELFEDAGGFPPLYINEDMEFGIELSSRCRVLWDDDNGVYHNFRDGLKDYFLQQISWARSVMEFYLSNLAVLYGRNMRANSRIAIQLFLTVFLYCALAVAFFIPEFAPPLIFVAVLLFLVFNFTFLKFITEKEGVLFALRSIPLIFIRNTAWVFGMIMGFLRYVQIKAFGVKESRARSI